MLCHFVTVSVAYVSDMVMYCIVVNGDYIEYDDINHGNGDNDA